MARELTNKEYVIRQFDRQQRIWRTTTSGTIMCYSPLPDGRVFKRTMNRRMKTEYITYRAAVQQLVRNFKEIN